MTGEPQPPIPQVPPAQQTPLQPALAPLSPPPAYQAYPPMFPGALPPPRPVWPMVIGIIAIVFGSLAALGGAWGVLGIALMGWLPSVMPKPPAGQPDPTQFMTAILAWQPWLIAVSVATLLIAIWLLTGGIMLIKRRAAARMALISWAIAKMALVLASVAVNYHVQQAQFAAMQQAGGPMSGMAAIMSAVGVVSIALGVIWGWILPVFMLIWFARPRIARQVRAWRGEPGLQA